MKNRLFSIMLLSAILATSCGDGNVMIREDPSIQAAEDNTAIVNYINDLGYSDVDSVLSSGVHFVILDAGSSEIIDESDIVTFNYVGKLLNDTIFDTSIKKVADSIRTVVEENTAANGDTLDIELAILSAFDEDRAYKPFEIVYSASGWTIDGKFIDGFTDGISATFRLLRVGGSALIVIPSAEAYGTQGSGLLIKPNTVIAFELFPTAVEKQ
ncbi:MAG: FKBP-type peptidyl-prolyl cis-trans isomerase [Ekhidna sp.]|nr:FKBP-type peptidyl-prolyl cis-trans isomerase [Ekhidna sp.]